MQLTKAQMAKTSCNQLLLIQLKTNALEPTMYKLADARHQTSSIILKKCNLQAVHAVLICVLLL